MSKRGPYTKNCEVELARLEKRRKAAGVTLDAWRIKSLISERTFRRIRLTKRAYPATIRQLSTSLTALVRERGEVHMLELVAHD